MSLRELAKGFLERETVETRPHRLNATLDDNSLIPKEKHPKKGVSTNSQAETASLAADTADFVAAVKQYWPGAKDVDQRLPEFIEEAFTANETELETEMYAMVNGYLFRDPEEKTSKAGKVYVKATLKEGKGEDVQFVTVMAFSGANADALMQGKDGDAVSVVGELKMRCYEKDGTWRPAADILANKVTLLTRTGKQAPVATAAPPSARMPTAELINDDLPF